MAQDKLEQNHGGKGCADEKPGVRARETRGRQRALSAYTLLDQLRERGFRAPLQVYRALDTLVKSGFVHRLESINSFVACAEPHDHSHSMTAFAICDTCGQVTEMSDHDVDHRLNEWVSSTGFAAKKAVIEFRGVCAKCRAEAA